MIRVFPRRTKATPDDDLAFVGEPPLFRPPADEVHISCAFTWDRARAEYLRDSWCRYYEKVKIGGPAYGAHGGAFVPGRYLKRGYVITSRGCPNRCSFCFVPSREGTLRTLPITEGWDVVDNNLLACPRDHVERVLDMLAQQPRAARFSGGLDCRRLEEWFVQRLTSLRLGQLWFAYDVPSQRKPVAAAIRLMRSYGYTRHKIGCYVLVGFDGDTQEAAAERTQFVLDHGGTPFAMYYRSADSTSKIPADWRKFIKYHCRPAAMFPRRIRCVREGGSDG